tara:strand:+ start:404 stop:871 length:468 start_codon:yes stop_codon:yes gene_type:complete
LLKTNFIYISIQQGESMQKTDSQAKMQLISQDNYLTEQTNLTEEPIMYEPESNRRPGVTRKYEFDNHKFYVNIGYDPKDMLPRVVRIWSDMKQGTTFSDMLIDLSNDITERLQIRKNLDKSLERMATAAPRRGDGSASTIQGLIVDELLKSYYLD